jgi:hypothetical protein
MGMRSGTTSIWGFWIQITGRPAAWIVGIVFSIVGGLILVFGPSLTSTAQDVGTAHMAVRILGVVFLGLGILVLAAMVVDLVLLARGSPRRDTYFWWFNFLCGLLAAGLFAIPATLIFPLMLIAYVLRPNGLFPVDARNDSNNLFVGLIFTLFGLGALLLMLFAGRAVYRNRPGMDDAAEKK